jgi:hypothetical protein
MHKYSSKYRHLAIMLNNVMLNYVMLSDFVLSVKMLGDCLQSVVRLS